MTVRVVIAEDSDIAAEYIGRTLQASGDISVIGRARSANELLSLDVRAAAHVILLDMLMPERTGLSVIRHLASEAPIVVVSDVGADSPLAAEALAQGAAAFVSKRELATEAGALALRKRVIDAARGAKAAVSRHAIVLVGSTGAMKAYEKIIPCLSSTCASVVILQHMPSTRMQSFAEWVSSLGLQGAVARAGDVLRSGRFLVAPGERHTVIENPGRIRFVDGPAPAGHTPSATILLSSAAVLGARLTAVVLSGMGDDGAGGVAPIVERGGSCFVLHPDECRVPSMPRAAMAASPHVRALRMEELASELRRIGSRAH